MVAAVAENATVSDILAAREALLVLGIESLKTSSPKHAMQYFDEATRLINRLETNSSTPLPSELITALGEAFATALQRSAEQLAELEALWKKLPDDSQLACIKTIAKQKDPQPVKKHFARSQKSAKQRPGNFSFTQPTKPRQRSQAIFSSSQPASWETMPIKHWGMLCNTTVDKFESSHFECWLEPIQVKLS